MWQNEGPCLNNKWKDWHFCRSADSNGFSFPVFDKFNRFMADMGTSSGRSSAPPSVGFRWGSQDSGLASISGASQGFDNPMYGTPQKVGRIPYGINSNTCSTHILRAWCKTFVTSLFCITSDNSFAPSLDMPTNHGSFDGLVKPFWGFIWELELPLIKTAFSVLIKTV